jgi:Lon-like ATP-dependent protease
MKDVLIDDAYRDQIEVIPVDTLDEVMESALMPNENKRSLVERLEAIIDRLTPNPSGRPSA